MGHLLETLRLPGAYCISYHEQFTSSDVSGGSYQCFITLSDPTGWTIEPGGPAGAFVAPAARDHGVPGAAAAAASGVVLGEPGQPISPLYRSSELPLTFLFFHVHSTKNQGPGARCPAHY